MADNFLVGEVTRLHARIVDIDQQEVDPGSVAVKVKSPDDEVLTFLSSSGQIVRTAVGIYHLDLKLDLAGVWAWRWESAEPHAGAAEGLLMVEPSMVD